MSFTLNFFSLVYGEIVNFFSPKNIAGLEFDISFHSEKSNSAFFKAKINDFFPLRFIKVNWLVKKENPSLYNYNN